MHEGLDAAFLGDLVAERGGSLILSAIVT